MDIWATAGGDGPPLFFVHAALANSRMWEPQVASFTESHRVVTMDLRGFGRSCLQPDPFTHSVDVSKVLDRMEIESATFVGASLGGAVVLDLVMSQPDRVNGVVLVSSALPGFDWSPDVRSFAKAEDEAIDRKNIDAAVELNLHFWLGGSGGDCASLSSEKLSAVRTMQREAIEHIVSADFEPAEEIAVPELADRLGEIHKPAIVMVGEHDVPDMHTIAEMLAERIPNAARHVIAGAAHLPSYERPDQFNSLLHDFLTEHHL